MCYVNLVREIMKKYLTLIRPYGLLFLGLTPVFGAIANGGFASSHLIILLIIGSLIHIFGFAQNDYYDVEIDSKSKYVSKRPLVIGCISQKITIFIFVSSFLVSLLLSFVFIFTFFSFVVLLLSFLCMFLYNKYSKHQVGMEYILGLGVFNCGIYGALTVSNNISFFAILISSMGFMQWLFSVGISANLKDVEFDSKQGIRTTPIMFGVRISDKKLILPLSFIIYAFFIKFIHIIIASLSFFIGFTSIFIYNLPIPGICFLIISIILLYLTLKILSTPIKKRDKMLIYAGVQEGLSLLLIPIVLMSYLIENISIFTTFLLISVIIVWPIFWFRILFGKRMIPLE